MNTAEDSKDIVVVGAGIIGLCIAEKLASEGRQVCIIEHTEVAAGASTGNAGVFAHAEIIPLASAGIIRKSLKWFFNPTGPFSVVLRDLPQTGSWLLRFLQAAKPSVFTQSLETLAAMARLEETTLPQLLQRTQLTHLVRDTGAMDLYESEHALQADLSNWQLRKRYGATEFEILQGRELHDFQTGLSQRIKAAVYAPKDKMISNPKAYCSALHAAISQSEVSTEYSEVERLEAIDGGVRIYHQGKPPLRAKQLVLAAGPWSCALAKQLGDTIPLIGERGYNTTFPKHAFPELDKPLFFEEHGFIVSPLMDGIRVGGASEIASMERPADYRRSKYMADKARLLLPGLKDCQGSEWMGKRPSTPDTLPVISYSSATPHVVYAFGHGHLGLSLSSSTAQLVSDLIAERTPSFDINNLKAGRF